MVIGSVMPLMSISWKASLPISAAGTLPVIATIGTESRSAVPMPGDEVGRARTGRAHADADPPGHPRVAVGGVGAALLVPDEHVAQLGIVAEDVVQRQDHAARVAEDDVDALEQQRLAQDVGTDPGALEVAPLVEHALAGALDRGRLRRCRRWARGSAGRPGAHRPVSAPAALGLPWRSSSGGSSGRGVLDGCCGKRKTLAAPARVLRLVGGVEPSGARPSVSLGPAGSR